MKKWREMSEEERKERLDELSSLWPSMYHDHPRQANSPDYGKMREVSLEQFIKYIDFSIYRSYRAFKLQQEKKQREEYIAEMERFLLSYSQEQPEAAQMIKFILTKFKFYSVDYMNKTIRGILNMFPPANWPIRRGEEDE